MQIKSHKWESPNLEQEMEVVVYGTKGRPVLIFPSQGGKARDFEGFGMVDAAAEYIDSGQIRLFCVDSVDHQSWANWEAHPAARARRHEQYDRYIVLEAQPFILKQCRRKRAKCIAAGCSMGGYHAGNFYLRHPELFDAAISLSGLFQLGMFIGDYMDENVYFNSPIHYLPGLKDERYLSAYREGKLIICAGQGAWEDTMIADARAMEGILRSKAIPHWVDLWGHDVNHDWPWWRKQLPYFLRHLLNGGEGDE